MLYCTFLRKKLVHTKHPDTIASRVISYKVSKIYQILELLLLTMFHGLHTLKTSSPKQIRVLDLLKGCVRTSKTSAPGNSFTAIVRPKLGYSCGGLWSPYTITHRLQVENVQHIATRFILNYPQYMP